MWWFELPRCEKLVGSEHAAVLAFLVKDIGWITRQPLIGIPAMLVAFALQAHIVMLLCCWGVGGGMNLAHQGALFFWLTGNAIWMCGEYLWEKPQPDGFLSVLSAPTKLRLAWYRAHLEAAACVMWVTCALLLVVYGACAFARWQARGWRWRQLEEEVEEEEQQPQEQQPQEHQQHQQAQHGLEELNLEVEAGASHIQDDEDTALVFGIELRVYRDAFIFPWLVMDACWAVLDLRDQAGLHPGLWLVLCAASGLAAAMLCGDCIRRYAAAGQKAEALLCMGELLWVAGNIIWAVDDVLTPTPPSLGAWASAVGLFAVGALLTVCTGGGRTENQSADEEDLRETTLELSMFPSPEKIGALELGQLELENPETLLEQRSPSQQQAHCPQAAMSDAI
eukprot:gnl/TRDRNA2_/TRDRNA2_192358_c0_seq1.p1 gnl/TRDRNA2_/TRDRNA2_192358_c0~~gnl/TRDRNA2_/TRDRNA2_192358_c0_seq1.p1  ORF type:complete len:394 (+),score=98.79 gnl/TRDRNA2_/TRDRNA2_192358_c0_seq1:109-1290(+)